MKRLTVLAGWLAAVTCAGADYFWNGAAGDGALLNGANYTNAAGAAYSVAPGASDKVVLGGAVTSVTLGADTEFRVFGFPNGSLTTPCEVDLQGHTLTLGYELTRGGDQIPVTFKNGAVKLPATAKWLVGGNRKLIFSGVTLDNLAQESFQICNGGQDFVLENAATCTVVRATGYNIGSASGELIITGNSLMDIQAGPGVIRFDNTSAVYTPRINLSDGGGFRIRGGAALHFATNGASSGAANSAGKRWIHITDGWMDLDGPFVFGRPDAGTEQYPNDRTQELRIEDGRVEAASMDFRTNSVIALRCTRVPDRPLLKASGALRFAAGAEITLAFGKLPAGGGATVTLVEADEPIDWSQVKLPAAGGRVRALIKEERALKAAWVLTESEHAVEAAYAFLGNDETDGAASNRLDRAANYVLAGTETVPDAPPGLHNNVELVGSNRTVTLTRDLEVRGLQLNVPSKDNAEKNLRVLDLGGHTLTCLQLLPASQTYDANATYCFKLVSGTLRARRGMSQSARAFSHIVLDGAGVVFDTLYGDRQEFLNGGTAVEIRNGAVFRACSAAALGAASGSLTLTGGGELDARGVPRFDWHYLYYAAAGMFSLSGRSCGRFDGLTIGAMNWLTQAEKDATYSWVSTATSPKDQTVQVDDSSLEVAGDLTLARDRAEFDPAADELYQDTCGQVKLAVTGAAPAVRVAGDCTLNTNAVIELTVPKGGYAARAGAPVAVGGALTFRDGATFDVALAETFTKDDFAENVSIPVLTVGGAVSDAAAVRLVTSARGVALEHAETAGGHVWSLTVTRVRPTIVILR